MIVQFHHSTLRVGRGRRGVRQMLLTLGLDICECLEDILRGEIVH